MQECLAALLSIHDINYMFYVYIWQDFINRLWQFQPLS